MDIHLIYDPSCASAPTAFRSALNYAASELGNTIRGGGSVNIAVGWGECGGAALAPGDLGMGGPTRTYAIPYTTMLDDETQTTASAVAFQALENAPWAATHPDVTVCSAQLKAWGAMAQDAAIDGVVGFSATQPFAMNPAHRAMPGKYDLIGAAEHEIGHVLGRFAGDGMVQMSHYSGLGTLDTGNGDGYFSLDGGRTVLRSYAPAWMDGTDWAPGTAADAFDAVSSPGVMQPLSAVDVQEIGSLGYNVAQPYSRGMIPPGEHGTVGLSFRHPVRMGFVHG